MKNIKAIETVYNGYRFRSRLEARWAVFFDTAKIKYEYEPEGYVLQNGKWYLPDFYLPKYKCYVEIKPDTKQEISEGYENLRDLFMGKDDCCCILCVGEPLNSHMFLVCQEITDGSGGLIEDTEVSFFEDAVLTSGLCLNGINLFAFTSQKDTYFCDRNWDELSIFQYKDLKTAVSLQVAMEKARQARFEYGEQG